MKFELSKAMLDAAVEAFTEYDGKVDDAIRVAVEAVLPHLYPSAAWGDALVDTARRNIRQFIGKASFSSSADKQSALLCVDVLEAALASRQPVGQEPVAWLIERLRGKGYGRDKYVVMKGQASSDPDNHLFWTDQQARDNHRVTPLYAAPPAQAVDLTASEREWLQYAIDHMRDDSEPEDATCANVLQVLLARFRSE